MSQLRPRFLTAEWRHLVMLNFAVDPAILRHRVPQHTELDEWNGRCYVSIVGFRFLDTRLLGWPIHFHRNFDEVNLRFYVRRHVDGEVRRGVVFIKEIVPLPAVSWVARRVYNENYITLPMRHTIDLPIEAGGERGFVEYAWRANRTWMSVSANVQGQPQPLIDGSEEEFITEHYWGYARQRDGATMEYRVEHPRWRVWSAESSRLDCDVRSLYGAEFSESLSAQPISAFVADGSEIVVRMGTRIA